MLMCQLSAYLYAEAAPVPSLLHIWRELTDRHVNWSQCCWCVNCQLICMQKVHLCTAPSLTGRHTLLSQSNMLMCQLSAYLYAEGSPLKCCHFAHIWREHTEPIGMSTCPNAVDVSTVSSFVCRRSIFRLFPVCFIPRFYFLAISQNCHSTQNYEIILKNETIFWNFKENWRK